MSPSKNMLKLINDYNKILVRDLGFSEGSDWQQALEKIMEILNTTALGNFRCDLGKESPGLRVARALITGWLRNREGLYWKNLFSIKTTPLQTPYYDNVEYEIHIKDPLELTRELTGQDVYQNYDEIKRMFESPDYLTLKRLDGIKVTIRK